MKITITRVSERRHRTAVSRDDGVVLQVPDYGRPTPLPHDLAHYVVEQTLGIRRGFWATVADGAKFPGMAIVAGRQRPHADARSKILIKANQQHLCEVEVLVDLCLAAFDRNWAAKPAVVRAHLKERWDSKRPVSAKVDPAAVLEVCSALSAMTKRWRALNTGDSIELGWPVSPARRRRATQRRRGGRSPRA